MSYLDGAERARYVESMFTSIAPRYDLMNRLMTFGQDVMWRKQVIKRAGLSNCAKLLDLGAGTGNLALLAAKQCPDCFCIAADFTLQMMQVGRLQIGSNDGQGQLAWAGIDAQSLPFPPETFDALVSGFLIRNLSDISPSLREQYRVLKPGGRIIILDTTPPKDTFIKPLIQFHLHHVIPTLGKFIAGSQDAYTYLPESTEQFLEPEQLANRMLQAGFRNVTYRRLMFGTVAIHWGVK